MGIPPTYPPRIQIYLRAETSHVPPTGPEVLQGRRDAVCPLRSLESLAPYMERAPRRRRTASPQKNNKTSGYQAPHCGRHPANAKDLPATSACFPKAMLVPCPCGNQPTKSSRKDDQGLRPYCLCPCGCTVANEDSLLRDGEGACPSVPSRKGLHGPLTHSLGFITCPQHGCGGTWNLPFLSTRWAQCPDIISVSAHVPIIHAFTGFSVILSFIHPWLAVQKQTSSKILARIPGRDVLDFPAPVSLTPTQGVQAEREGPRQTVD